MMIDRTFAGRMGTLTFATALTLTAAAALAPASAAGTPQPGAIAAPPRPTPAQLAATAAAQYVARRPGVLHASGADAFVAKAPVTGARGVQYVPYRRTYHGLPVDGGDFTVITNSAGGVLRVVTGSLMRTLTLGVRAGVSQAAAEHAALAGTRNAHVIDTTLVVDAYVDPARLAYRVEAVGATSNGPTRPLSYVDAVTGRVLSTRDLVQHGEGTGALNGPNPLHLDTTAQADGTFSMADPTRPAVGCGNDTSQTILTGPDDTWGNGDGTNIETGCVDALFAAQREWDMLHDWLGRNGFKGSGQGFPVYVGLNDVNAYWNFSSVEIGHNTAGDWISALDVVGHEIGHGIDTYTPQGISSTQIAEGVADIFGTTTEWYANEASPYDVPDYTIGEQVNLVGTGPIRIMYDPSQVGDPSCYSSSIPSTETHSAAGPLDHWFYLLAEGSNPTDGQPASATCNGTTVTGVGIRTAAVAFYNGLLAKPSNATYISFRHATLAAVASYDTTCQVFDAAKAAFDAVSVPAQSGEATCTPPQPQTITFPAIADRTYGAADLAPGATATSGLTVTYSSATPSTCSIVSAKVHLLAAGTCTVLADQAGNAHWLPAPEVSRSFTILPAPLTVTALSAAVNYGDGTPAITPSYSGFVNGETAAVLTSPATCSTAVTASTPVGTYPSTCSGAAAANYTINYVDGTVTVNPAPLTVTASDGSSTYGTAPPPVTPSYAGFRNGEDAGVLAVQPTCSVPVSPLTPVGQYASSCGGAQAGNYVISYLPGVYTVLPATLVARADDKTRAYGEANPALTYSLSGFVNGETAAVVSGAPLLSTSATASSLPGDYPIHIATGTLSAQNYVFSLVDGTLHVQPAPVTVVAKTISILRSAYHGQVTFAATVTNALTGAAAAGDVVVFTARTSTGYTFGCSATATSTGLATCTSSNVLATVLTLPPTYTASAQPSTYYLAGSATGRIRLL